jgi:hypothetical protein
MTLIRRAAAWLLALAVACAAPAALAQNIPLSNATGGVTSGTPTFCVDPASGTSCNRAAYTETTVTVGTSWTLLLAASTTRQRVLIGDAAGVGCWFSFNASPATNEGFPISDAGTKGVYVIDNPQSTGAIYAKCQGAGTTVTLGVS